jgi:hypothetical protein
LWGGAGGDAGQDNEKSEVNVEPPARLQGIDDEGFMERVTAAVLSAIVENCRVRRTLPDEEGKLQAELILK